MKLPMKTSWLSRKWTAFLWYLIAEAATKAIQWKKVFLEISENSKENTNASAQSSNFIKKRLWYKCFPVNFLKFLRKPFLQNTSGRLLFQLLYWKQSKLKAPLDTKCLLISAKTMKNVNTALNYKSEGLK